MAKEAKIYTFTRIHLAAESFKNDTPFLLAVIEEGEERVLARVEGKAEIKIGDVVEKTGELIGDQPVYRLK